MKIGVIGNGMTATFMVGLLLKNGFKVAHYIDPYKVPHSWASAGIVHPFNFKIATWKKFGYKSFFDFLQFLEVWDIKNFFHQKGLFYVCENDGLWNDWSALSERFPDFINIKKNGVFFPKSGWLEVKKAWDVLNNKFLKFSNYQRICDPPNLIKEKNIPIFVHAGGIDALKDHVHLPIYPKDGKIFKIQVEKPIISFVYWKQFFVTPTNNPLEYWIGPDQESLQNFFDTFQLEFKILKILSGVKPYSLLGRSFCIKQNQYIFLNGVGGRGLLEGIRIANEAIEIIKINE